MRKESKDVEFKEKITKSYLKTVSAYSNYKNGKIIFGINDEGKVIGLEKVMENKLNIENTINDTIKPKPEYTLDIEKIDGKSCIVLDVKKGDFPPYYYNGKAYKRNDTSTIEVDKVELNRLILQGSNLDYEAIEIENEKLEVVGRNNMIGEIVKVKVDRPLGSFHPDYPEHIYPINYGYVEGIIASDGEEQDVYILGVNEVVDEYEGEVIAVIKREDDIEEKWVVAPIGIKFTVEQIEEAVRFQEKYFKTHIEM